MLTPFIVSRNSCSVPVLPAAIHKSYAESPAPPPGAPFWANIIGVVHVNDESVPLDPSIDAVDDETYIGSDPRGIFSVQPPLGADNDRLVKSYEPPVGVVGAEELLMYINGLYTLIPFWAFSEFKKSLWDPVLPSSTQSS